MLSGMLNSKLKIINSTMGSVRHCLKNNDLGFNGFGEIYFSTINKNSIKAWKLHKIMTMNLTVQYGSVFFCFKDNRQESDTYNNICKVILNDKNYVRLTVPPNIWFGFKGLSDSLVCNISDIRHSESEVIRKDLKAIHFNWDRINNI